VPSSCPRRSSRALWLALVLSLALALGARLGAEPPGRLRHVRPLDPSVGDLLAYGDAASSTIRALIAALDRSDVIVHIERVSRPGDGLAGSTRFVTRAGGYRYIRITLFGHWSTRQTLALLGHELQHALEIATATWVVDQDTCLELFHAIGRRSCNQRRLCYETDAAIEAGAQVMRDLRMHTE
jgi:hypothetical protein